MSGNEKKARTIDFNKAKIVSTYKDLNRLISDNNDIVSRLTRRLQTSLNISDIIHMYAEDVRSLVTFDQFTYDGADNNDDNKTTEDRITIGEKPGTHSCQYNLEIDNDDLGSIRFSRRKRFIEEELAIIERLASTLVFPLRNATLYQSALQSALRDDLTGCGNKRALDASLHREAELSRRHNTPLSIVMLDADHFKQINDNYGHIAGDAVLKGLATTIKRCARQSDLCFRYGGEEFLVILDNTDANQALNIADRIRKTVERHTFSHNGKIIPVTISLGAATFQTKETLECFKHRADQALYCAKKNGRNMAISSELECNDTVQHPAQGAL